MAKRKPQEPPARLDYSTQAEPRAVTADGIPVFCSHDALIAIEEAVPNPRNPNQHTEQQADVLGNIIQATGWRQPITISKRSGFITKGHGRLLAAQRKGWKQVPADFQEYATEAEEWSDLIADNRLAELSTIDNERLVDLIKEIGDDVPMELTGFSNEDITDIIAALEKAGGVAEDVEDDKADAAEPEEGPAVTQAGDIWHLGAHRLICGDATDEATVERLMQGEKAELVNTDPPYGVSYISISGRFDDGIMNDTLTGDSLLNTLLIPAFRNYVKHTTEEAAFYIWHASSSRRDFEDAMMATGIIEKQYIIWVKNNFVMGHANYHWNHEPCFYAEKAGHTAHWYGDRTQSTTWKATLRDEDGAATTLTGGIVITDGEGNKLYLTSEPPKGKKIRRIRLQKGRSVYLFQPDGKTTDTWEVTKDAHVDHPTQKPVELAIRAINNNTTPGDLVIDFFGGSGSTLRAAEMTGRRCYTLELDPRYCDLTVKGYIALTGDVSVVCERDGAKIACTELFDPSV